MKKWQCTICGYIHSGDAPPEVCPVCGADKSQFTLVVEETPQPAAEKAPSPVVGKTRLEPGPSPASSAPLPLLSSEGIRRLMIKHHLHPITVHFPNGIIPMAAAFIFLAVIFQFAGLATASFYSMVFVLITLPAALFTGWNEWQKKYKGAMTPVFKIKILSALTVSACTLVSVLWSLIAPDVLKTPSTGRTLFLLLHVILLGATVSAGHLGGKLVFKD